MNTSFRKKLTITALAIATSCCFNYSNAQNFERDEERFVLKGSKIEFQAQGLKDEQIVVDPISGKEITKSLYGSLPSSVNGKKICEWSEVTTKPLFNPIRVSPPASSSTAISIDEYLLDNLKEDKTLRSLPDGVFRISLRNIVIDENGHVICFDYYGLRFTQKDDVVRSLNDSFLISNIDRLLSTMLPMKPAMMDGNKVPVRLNTVLSGYRLDVKKHVIACSRDATKSVPLR